MHLIKLDRQRRSLAIPNVVNTGVVNPNVVNPNVVNPNVVNPGVVNDDPWRQLGDDEPLPDTGDVIVTHARYLAEGAALLSRRGRTGIGLPGDTDPETCDGAARFDLVAVHFPTFTDGRGYTLARLLRERYAFAGELRARGAVVRDQLLYLARCGFDAFELPAEASVDDALAAFADFSLAYQPAAYPGGARFRRIHAPLPEAEPVLASTTAANHSPAGE